MCDHTCGFHVILSVTLPLLLPLSSCVWSQYNLPWMCFVTWRNSWHSLIFHIFLLPPIFLSSRLVSLAPLSKLLWCSSFFFFLFSLSQLIMCDHPTIKAATKELPWQHLVHAVTRHCGESREAETARTQTNTQRHISYPPTSPRHTGNPCSLAFTASGSVKVIIDFLSQSQRS